MSKKAVSGFLLMVLLIALVVEAAVIGTAYLTADEVECKSIGPVPLYCTFTDHVSTEVKRTQTCFRNGEKINCSKLEDSFPDGEHIE